MLTPKITPTSTAISAHARQVDLVRASLLMLPVTPRAGRG